MQQYIGPIANLRIGTDGTDVDIVFAMKKLSLLLLSLSLWLVAGVHTVVAQPLSTGRWVGTWATAQQVPVRSYMPHNNNLSGCSVRQVVKVSIGGELLHLRLSNELSSEPLVIRSVYVATALDSSDIVPRSAHYLRFGGSYKATIMPGKAIVSDPLPFALKPLQKLAITINYTSAPDKPTVHMGSRTTSYIIKGVTNAHSSFKHAFKENHWFNIDAVDVYSSTAQAIAIIGNSITDGKNSTDNANNRWPDILSETLHRKYKNTYTGVLNLGIGNNRVVVPGGFGENAKVRFYRDVLSRYGLSAVVIFEGVNDIGAAHGNSETVARQLIEAYEDMVQRARANHLRVYIGTIMPFKGAAYYSPFHEAARETVNEWIRKQRGNVDGILDFDELMRDATDPKRLKPSLQSDWLHPNPEGYRLMGEYAAEVLK